MENKNDRKALIAVLVVALVAVASLTISFYVKYKDAKKNNNDTQEVENNKESSVVETKYTKEEIDEKTYQVVAEGTDGYFGYGEYTLNINNLKIELTNDKGIGYILVNGNKIADRGAGGTEIYALDSTTIFVALGTMGGANIYVVNNNGELIKEVYFLDNNYEGMVISSEDNSLIINKDGLKFKGTRSLTVFNPKDGKSQSDCSTVNKYADEVIYGTYEMKYLGNGTFGEIENTGYTLVKDSDITCQ